MKCPACDQHTTSFASLLEREQHLYMMPFMRTCPRCGARIRLGKIPLLALIGLVLSLHSAIEVGMVIARRYNLEEDHAVIGTILVYAVPFWLLLYLVWKHGRYMRR